ncbi:MAG: type 2 isopentenyl-diphosphate Delta-isomerase, partial [Heliobacteriaceae bacterium]|nr:type 2 isopentenyl-diphosphate Delta-isomerase [Heliobacteriaceae bacterium]
DVHLVHNALPGVDFSALDPATVFLAKTLKMPLLINALTGGNRQVTEVNRQLARIAARTGVAIAAGSQTAALHRPELAASFRVLREENPDGVVIANVSADTPAAGACQAVEMLAADGLQVHLNAAQELAMQEGERNFTSWAANIERLVQACPVPVIVKEVGCGIAGEVAHRLLRRGVRFLDVSGAGGTNFVAIELRRQNCWAPSFERWGIPSAISLAEVLWAGKCFEGSGGEPVTVIASGGIRDGWEIAKALAMGARLAGIAGPVLKKLLGIKQQTAGLTGSYDTEAVVAYLDTLRQGLALSMALTGCRTVAELRHQPCLVTGATKDWLVQRGIPPAFWARKRECR